MAALACIPLAGLLPAASAQTFPPLTWTAPVLVEHAPFALGHTVTAASCPSVRLCVVGDDVGNILTSTDPASTTDTWKTAAISPGNSIAFLTCSTKGFCVALATVKGRERIFTSVNPAGGARGWAVARAPMLLRSISCPSTRLCVAVGKGAIATSADPAAGRHSVWKVTSFGPQLAAIHITGVSCPRLTLCVAGDEAGNVYTTTNPTGGKSAWTVALLTTMGLRPVTCPSASFCAVLDDSGNLSYSTNPVGGRSTWHPGAGPPAFATKLTCVSATFCAAVARNNGITGELAITTHPEGDAAWQVVDIAPHIEPNIVSCASPHLCVAGDSGGDVSSSRNPGGGLPAWTTFNITGVSAIVRLDCPIPAFCVAGDNAGKILTSTRPGGGASAWHPANVGITAVSCPTSKFCVAAGFHGNVRWSTNPAGGTSAWSKTSVETLPEGFVIDSISCPTTSLCVAADTEGNILTSTNPTGGASAWQVAPKTDSRHLYVSCPTASLCLASGDDTILASTNPAGGASTWHATAFFPKASGIGPITCPAPALCVAIGQYNFTPDSFTPTIFSSAHPTGGILDWNLVKVTPVYSGPAGTMFNASGGTVSCPSARFCLAGFGSSSSVFASSDPASAKASAWPKAGVFANAVSCPSPSLCVAGNLSGQVQIGTPRAPTEVSG